MSQVNRQKLYSILLDELSDGLNRSLRALEEAGAIDTNLLRQKYKGVGSEYYDLFTEQLEFTANHGADVLSAAIALNDMDPQDR